MGESRRPRDNATSITRPAIGKTTGSWRYSNPKKRLNQDGFSAPLSSGWGRTVARPLRGPLREFSWLWGSFSTTLPLVYPHSFVSAEQGVDEIDTS